MTIITDDEITERVRKLRRRVAPKEPKPKRVRRVSDRIRSKGVREEYEPEASIDEISGAEDIELAETETEYPYQQYSAPQEMVSDVGVPIHGYRYPPGRSAEPEEPIPEGTITIPIGEYTRMVKHAGRVVGRGTAKVGKVVGAGAIGFGEGLIEEARPRGGVRAASRRLGREVSAIPRAARVRRGSPYHTRYHLQHPGMVLASPDHYTVAPPQFVGGFVPRSRMTPGKRATFLEDLEDRYPSIYNRLEDEGLTESQQVGYTREYYPDIYDELVGGI